MGFLYAIVCAETCGKLMWILRRSTDLNITIVDREKAPYQQLRTYSKIEVLDYSTRVEELLMFNVDGKRLLGFVKDGSSVKMLTYSANLIIH